MKRRRFLEVTAGSVVPLGGALSRAAGAVPEPSGKGAVASFHIEEATLPTLHAALEAGTETANSLTARYLARIASLDREGPAINSVIEINPEATTIAQGLDTARAGVRPSRGPLHGIPVLLKDNIDTHDRMSTTAGSLALVGSVPLRDSTVAQKLRTAGAVILGKTNLSEWANFRSSRSTSGWSGRGGQTRNPYVLDRNPSGSSSGSAAAVSANFCAVAIGTETDGSIVSPASLCGIVGLKPTLGLISRAGIIPIAHSQDTAGPMTRTVRDAAILLGVLTGVDPRDPATEAGRGRTERDYTTFLDPDGLRGRRIGVVRKLFRSGALGESVLKAALEAMKRQGAILVDPVEIPTLGKFGDAEYEVLLYEFKAGLNAYLAGLGPTAPVQSLADVIAFNERHRDREMPYFGQETFLAAQAKGPLTDKAYQDALARGRRLAGPEGIDAVMNEHRLDALVAPSGGPAHRTDFVHGDRGVGGSSSIAAVAGYPNITVPAGDVLGLPLGLSFFGRAFNEPMLFKIAHAFEQATRARKAPRFLVSIEPTSRVR